MKILVVDSHNDQRPDARLPSVLAALGRFRSSAEGFRSVRRPTDRGFHDLLAYDLALVHESDARLDNAAFYKLCVRVQTPCVLFSGGTGRASGESSRLLFVADRDLLTNAEDGIVFLQRTGRLDLTAWTQGLAAARRAEIHRLCEPLRRVLRRGEPDHSELLIALDVVPKSLRGWCDSRELESLLDSLLAIFSTVPGEDPLRAAAWLEQNRESLSTVLRTFVGAV